MSDQETATGQELRLTETIAAPPEAVFEFLVDPDKMLRWMGSEVRIEPEPGGLFWVNATGTDIAVGTYVEVDPPKKIVFTWGWEGSADVPPGSSTVTITLTPRGDDTMVELVHVGLPMGADDSHAHGWVHYLGRLNAVAIGVDPDTSVPYPAAEPGSNA